MNYYNMEFQTALHKTAFEYYNNLPTCECDINTIFTQINENNLESLIKTYNDSTQFTVNRKLREFWNNEMDDETPPLTGVQEDILIFILNMYFCNKSKEKRYKRLKKGHV